MDRDWKRSHAVSRARLIYGFNAALKRRSSTVASTATSTVAFTDAFVETLLATSLLPSFRMPPAET